MSNRVIRPINYLVPFHLLSPRFKFNFTLLQPFCFVKCFVCTLYSSLPLCLGTPIAIRACAFIIYAPCLARPAHRPRGDSLCLSACHQSLCLFHPGLLHPGLLAWVLARFFLGFSSTRPPPLCFREGEYTMDLNLKTNQSTRRIHKTLTNNQIQSK